MLKHQNQRNAAQLDVYSCAAFSSPFYCRLNASPTLENFRLFFALKIGMIYQM